MYGNDRYDRNESNSGFNRGGFVAPVRVGEEIEVKIEAVGEKGDGIAKKKGFVIFVPEVAKDDMVKIKITKVLKKVAFAEVVEKLDSISEENNNANEQAARRAAPPVEEDILPEIPEEDFEDASEDFGEESLEEPEKEQVEAPAEEILEDVSEDKIEADSEELSEDDSVEEISEEDKKQE